MVGMGRAQGQVTDHFSTIFGNRRGLGQRHEQTALQIRSLFSRDRDAARRRAKMVRWWIDNDTKPLTIPHFTMFSGAYDDGWHFEKKEKKQQLADSACRNDLNRLIEQGICKKVRFNPAPAGPIARGYELLPLGEWSAKQRLVFTAWQMVGCPDW